MILLSFLILLDQNPAHSGRHHEPSTEVVLLIDQNDLRSKLGEPSVLKHVFRNYIYGWVDGMRFNSENPKLSIINYRRGNDNPRRMVSGGEMKHLLQFEDWPDDREVFHAYEEHLKQQKDAPLMNRAFKGRIFIVVFTLPTGYFFERSFFALG